ncbi:MFS family permease [Rhodococcus sp. LBL1]|nr:MFS family permease [Rhodococcus sp. LBL1]MDH6685138.1 MFS family permease [Rhodococcus sp. LBL2]
MSIDHATEAGSRTSRSREIRKVVLSSYVGSVLEYYDFLLYGTAAAIAFGPVFFSGMSSAAGTMASFATFAAGYLARPLGGVLFGHLGDRVGRKSMLILSLSVMGVTSVLIGLVPSSASIGSWAPVLLVSLRVIQGIALGGEWGGSVLMSLEHSDKRSRGFVTAFTYAGAPSGALLGTAAMAIASGLPEEQFLQWGWRIPFLLSGVMLVVGLYVRASVSESPVFLAAARRAAAEKRTADVPIVDTMRQWRTLLSVATSGIAGFAIQTTFATFAITYAVNSGAERSVVLAASAVSQGLAIMSGLAFAKLSDRVGRRPVMLGGVAGTVILLYPSFLLLGRGEFLPAVAGFVLCTVCLTAVHGPLPAFITEQFGTLSRYTGSSLGYQIATLVGGGLSPLAITALFSASGGSILAVTALIAGLCAISGIAIARSRETKDNDLETVGIHPQRNSAVRQEGKTWPS